VQRDREVLKEEQDIQELREQ